MWWSVVVEGVGMKLGGFNGDVLGDGAAKKAAKALGRDYLKRGGPGSRRLIKSPLPLDGCMDMTVTARSG